MNTHERAIIYSPNWVIGSNRRNKKFPLQRIPLSAQKLTEAVVRRCSVNKVSLWRRCFLVNFAKFLRTPFFTEHLRGLLLNWSRIRNWLLVLRNRCLFWEQICFSKREHSSDNIRYLLVTLVHLKQGIYANWGQERFLDLKEIILQERKLIFKKNYEVSFLSYTQVRKKHKLSGAS